MKQRFAILIFRLCITLYTLNTSAQKHDYVWLSGYSGGRLGYDPNSGFYFGTTVLDFNNTPRSAAFDSSYKMNFNKATTSYCDSNGILMFYTNGIYIANSLNEKIENSDSLNAGYGQYNIYPNMQIYGYRTTQGILCVQNPHNPIGAEQYFLIHTLFDTVNSHIRNTKVLLTLLDMSWNMGHGKVLFKNQTILHDIIGGELSGVRHGNGKDWWFLEQKGGSSCYYRLLLNDTGVYVMPVLGCGGIGAQEGDYGASCFSPDGSKYVYMGFSTGISIFDFNRCTGELSNPVSIPLPSLAYNFWMGLGVAISPNNRFLYTSVTQHLYQFDLLADDIAASIDTVGIFDGTNAPFPAIFATSQIGPDGKIYISCGNADTTYHVINQPDLKGDSCDFRQHSLSLPSPSWGVPNFPNYRLGRLVRSPCDTLWNNIDEQSKSEREKILKVFPNPATTDVTIDYGFTDWSKSRDIIMEIVNELGQQIHYQTLPQYSGFQRLNVSSYAQGMYMAYIKRNNQVIATSKFAKQ